VIGTARHEFGHDVTLPILQSRGHAVIVTVDSENKSRGMNAFGFKLFCEFNPYYLIRPLLFRMDAEKAHHLITAFLKKGIGPRLKNDFGAALQTTICGLNFPNPIGLAAGFDKQAEFIDEMFHFGFGSVEVGSMTPLPQPGNPQPRLFRVPKAEAIINRFGFNSDGYDVCLRRITAYYDATINAKRGVIGANIGKNKNSSDAIGDYVAGVTAFAPFVDYLAINISSPNTPHLRDLQSREPLADLLKQVMEARNASRQKPPVFVKIAPDLTPMQQEDIAHVILDSGVQGVIIGNTTLTRPEGIPQALANEAGGLSGKPLFDLSTKVLSNISKLTGGRLPLIGCGGVSSGADAYAKIRAGASLVQIYTALVYEGPLLVRCINRELAALLARDGFERVEQAVGVGP
jgi:dihydroorotate dehydrogenase